MTLIETLVALALLALLSGGLIASFRVAERAYRKVTRLDSSAWDIVTAQRFLRQTLESAYPARPRGGDLRGEFGLEGDAEVMTFTAPMPQSAGSGGFFRYVLTVYTSRTNQKSLLVRWSPERDAAGQSTAADRSEVLLRGIDLLEWSYLEPPDILKGRLTAQWLSNWNANPQLPILVRLRVRFPPGDARSWPELLVAPRVTDEAFCRFDSVSQACRED